MFQPQFRPINSPQQPRTEAYWITHAGGSTNTLVHRMRTIAQQDHLQVLSPWMPAREEMANATFDGDLDEMARLLGDKIVVDRAASRSDRPFVLIGHSFGSVLAYRIAGHLQSQGVLPHRLLALSFPAPDTVHHEQPLHRLSDEQLIHQVDELFGGIPENIRSDPQAQSFFAPGLRFDLALLESYVHDRQTELLRVPITAICGIDDRAVDLAQMQGWQRLTSAGLRLRGMPGDHFFAVPRMPEILTAACWDIAAPDNAAPDSAAPDSAAPDRAARDSD